MQLVRILEEALANVARLELVRTAGNPLSAEPYRSLIKRGTCFLPYVTPEGIAFAPSRFIGYIGNTFEKHATNRERDGRQTNAALNIILGHRPIADQALENEYQRFCAALGLIPSLTGTFGVNRKYWIPPDIGDRLDLLAEQSVIDNPALTQTEKQQITKARVGQGVFRAALLTKWKSRCCLTRCDVD